MVRRSRLPKERSKARQTLKPAVQENGPQPVEAQPFFYSAPACTLKGRPAADVAALFVSKNPDYQAGRFGTVGPRFSARGLRGRRAPPRPCRAPFWRSLEIES